MMFEYKYKPYPYQEYAIERFRDSEYFALFCDMGTGKTKMNIDIAAWKFYNNQINLLVVLAPKNVYLNWYYTELPKHMPVDYVCKTYWSGMGKRDMADLKSFYQLKTNILKILLINIESIRTEKGFNILKVFLKDHKSFITVDESTVIKSHNSIQGKRSRELSPLGLTKSILTGYPSPNSCLDYFGQIEFLKKGLSGHRSYFYFRNYYTVIMNCNHGNRNYPKVVGYQNEKELINRLSKFSVRYKKEDVLPELPDREEKLQHVKMCSEQERLYHQFREECLIELNDGEIVSAEHAMVKIQKLRQIATGFVKDDNQNWNQISDKKIEALKEDLSLIPNEKAIIWSVYVEEIKAIAKELKSACVTFYGENKDNIESQRIWENDPDVPYIIINPKSGAKGLTLIQSHYNFYISYDHNLDDMLQSKERTHRIGQTNKVFYIFYAMINTIEPKIIKVLQQKKKLGDIVLDKLRGFLSE